MITLIITIFLVGYLAIAAEHSLKVNKAAIALLTGVACWTVYMFTQEDYHVVTHDLSEHVGEISGILFFLMGAMTIVELIDAHDGFEIITNRITTRNQRKLIWILCGLTFFFSAILDNLATTIVMIMLVRKLLPAGNQRLMFASMIVIAANAGGAWSPIGDVTTTMLWIGGQITSAKTISTIILPSIVTVIVPLAVVSYQMKGKVDPKPKVKESALQTSPKERRIIFTVGVLSLIFVPIFKSITNLPPYMGILGALGLMWIITEVLHSKKEDKDTVSVLYALQKIDMPSILFFLGLLLSIGVLQHVGVLSSLATWLDQNIGDINFVVMIIGVLSAIVDNVPLVAASMGMYSLDLYPVNHYFWLFLAYSAGTGGSILIIGSAAGVAAMGIEKINFFWYLKNASWLALIGFLAGAGTFILQAYLLGLA